MSGNLVVQGIRDEGGAVPMGTAGNLDRRQAEREVGRVFLELLAVAGLSLIAIAVPVALFLFLRPFPLGPVVALLVVALGSWWFAARAGYGLAALVVGLAGGVLLFLAPVGPSLVRRPFQWLGREAVSLAALYVVLFVAAWVRTWYADAVAVDTEEVGPPVAGTTASGRVTLTAEYTDAEFVEKG